MLKVRHYITFLCALSMNFSTLYGMLPGSSTPNLLPENLRPSFSSSWLTPDIKNAAGITCAVALTAAVAWYGYKYYAKSPVPFSEADQREQDYQNGLTTLQTALPDLQMFIKYRKDIILPHYHSSIKNANKGSLGFESLDTYNITNLSSTLGDSSHTVFEYRRLIKYAQQASQTIAASMLQSTLLKNNTTLIAVNPAQRHNNHKIGYDRDKNTIFVSWMHLTPMFLDPNILIGLLAHEQGHVVEPKSANCSAARKNKDYTYLRTSEKNADIYAAQFTKHSCLGFISFAAHEVIEYAMIDGDLITFKAFNDKAAKLPDEIHLSPKDRLSLFVTHAKNYWHLEKNACYEAIQSGIAHAEQYINLGALPRRTDIATYKKSLTQEFQNIIDKIYA